MTHQLEADQLNDPAQALARMMAAGQEQMQRMASAWGSAPFPGAPSVFAGLRSDSLAKAADGPAPEQLGNSNYPPIEPAPGRYVIRKA